jgi:hypothetical protein
METIMSSHLISAVSENLTPRFTATVASVLGLDRGVVDKAIQAAVPGLLAGLAGMSSRPGGAQQLSNMIASPGVAQATEIVASTKARSLAEGSAGQVASLLGNDTFGAITGAVSKFAGMGEGSTKTLFGLLGPVVLNTLGQEQRSAGLDANGLARMLSSEKSEITSAMPSGISGILTELGILEPLEDTAGHATATARRYGDAARTYGESAATSASAYASQTARDVESGAPSINWLYWVVPLLAVLGLLWYLMSGDSTQTVSDDTVTKELTPPVQSPATPGVNWAQQVAQLGPAMTSLETSLRGITDPASATAAVPRLQALTTQIDRLGAVANQLPEGTRMAFASRIRDFKPRLAELSARVLAIPGVAPIVQQPLEALRAKVDALAA